MVPLNFAATSRLIHPSVAGGPNNLVKGLEWTRLGFRPAGSDEQLPDPPYPALIRKNCRRANW